jgi:hypothetical protein
MVRPLRLFGKKGALFVVARSDNVHPDCLPHLRASRLIHNNGLMESSSEVLAAVALLTSRVEALEARAEEAGDRSPAESSGGVVGARRH